MGDINTASLDLLEAVRSARELHYKDMAAEMHVSKAVISHVVSGRRELTQPAVVDAILRLVGSSLRDVVAKSVPHHGDA